MTLRDSILAADDLPRERVQTDEWGRSGVPFVYMRGFSGSEREAWERSQTVLGPNGDRIPNPRAKNVRAQFLVKLMTDENGDRIFADEDVEALSGKNAAVLERLAMVGLRLSGMIGDEANPSQDGQADDSYSDSPSPSENPTPTD